ncbi:MAG: hypothetical protein IPM54_38620 [Polyangiaceae bacterium]|nr:hypothetical protein [Polyangiaceae bacterium]
MATPLPPALIVPTSAADHDTLLPPEDYDEPAESEWIPAAPYWNAAPTMPLPPPRHEYPVPIPAGIMLIPTDVLPPAWLDAVIPHAPSSIPPPPMLGSEMLAPARPPLRAAKDPSSIPPAPISQSVAPEPVASTAIDLLVKSTFEPISLEQCAAMEALLALHPQRSPDILAEHDIDAPTWKQHFTHWQEAIRARLNQDDASLLAKHDDAFVSALEMERGSAITADDHAAIVASARRGTRTETLRALQIPTTAMSLVERVFLRRAATG